MISCSVKLKNSWKMYLVSSIFRWLFHTSEECTVVWKYFIMHISTIYRIFLKIPSFDWVLPSRFKKHGRFLDSTLGNDLATSRGEPETKATTIIQNFKLLGKLSSRQIQNYSKNLGFQFWSPKSKMGTGLMKALQFETLVEVLRGWAVPSGTQETHLTFWPCGDTFWNPFETKKPQICIQQRVFNTITFSNFYDRI